MSCTGHPSSTTQQLPSDPAAAVVVAGLVLQSRHETALDEAVQVLVGQLWSAYFSIGALQAHQQQLQQQLQQLLHAAQDHGWLGGAAAAAAGLAPLAPGGPGPPGPGLRAAAGAGAGADLVGDSLTAETSSVMLSELDDEGDEVRAMQCCAILPSCSAAPPWTCSACTRRTRVLAHGGAQGGAAGSQFVPPSRTG
jgi:hypothetical protein